MIVFVPPLRGSCINHVWFPRLRRGLQIFRRSAAGQRFPFPFVLVDKFFLRTISTEQCARAATAPATLPSRNLSTRLVRPVAPRKMQSARHSSANFTSSCFGSPNFDPSIRTQTFVSKFFNCVVSQLPGICALLGI